jgi:hypothetical protein
VVFAPGGISHSSNPMPPLFEPRLIFPDCPTSCRGDLGLKLTANIDRNPDLIREMCLRSEASNRDQFCDQAVIDMPKVKFFAINVDLNNGGRKQECFLRQTSKQSPEGSGEGLISRSCCLYNEKQEAVTVVFLRSDPVTTLISN